METQINKEEECLMQRGITLFDKLQGMKEEMDRVWNSLVEENPREKEQEGWQGIEKLPKFEGVGKSSRSRSDKSIKISSQ
jgi:hypothetical protein